MSINRGIPESEWISVKDKLPEINEFVLCFNKLNGVLIGFIDVDELWKLHLYRGMVPEPITHWMPMPAPPVNV